jgi:hypothetical protein
MLFWRKLIYFLNNLCKNVPFLSNKYDAKRIALRQNSCPHLIVAKKFAIHFSGMVKIVFCPKNTVADEAGLQKGTENTMPLIPSVVLLSPYL